MAAVQKKKPTGYDKYVDWKLFAIPVTLLFLILFLPALDSMKDVGTEYSVGTKTVIEHITKNLFKVAPQDAQQWQLLTAHIMEQNMRMGG